MPEQYQNPPSHQQLRPDRPFSGLLQSQNLTPSFGNWDQRMHPPSSSQQVPTSYGLFPPPSNFGVGPSQYYGGSSGPQFSSYGGVPSQMFGTSSLTPPSAYWGPSSSQQYYRPEIPFNVSEEGSQSVEVEDTDDKSESPYPPPQLERRPRRPTQRPPCGTSSHRWTMLLSNKVITLWENIVLCMCTIWMTIAYVRNELKLYNFFFFIHSIMVQLLCL